jgi:hypothetical protein
MRREASAGRHELGVDTPVREDDAKLRYAAAALSFTAALIHFSVAPAHFAEYWGFGVFFVVVGAMQLGWAELARRGAAGTAVLALGAAGNLLVALVWLASRSAGLPIGPEAGQAEGVGFHDALATLDELGIAVLLGVLLLGGKRHVAHPWLLGGAWALAGVSFVGAFLGGHGAG